MWARILEDRPFLDYFISENQKRLAARYAFVADFLRSHNIKIYEGGNAGLFIWIDLRDRFQGQSNARNSNALNVTSPGAEKLQDAEDRLFSAWWNKGVMMSKGTGCHTEEFGWFRMVITVEEECVKLGLQRFVDVLHGPDTSPLIEGTK